MAKMTVCGYRSSIPMIFKACHLASCQLSSSMYVRSHFGSRVLYIAHQIDSPARAKLLLLLLHCISWLRTTSDLAYIERRGMRWGETNIEMNIINIGAKH
jgi:hypothetical protein